MDLFVLSIRVPHVPLPPSPLPIVVSFPKRRDSPQSRDNVSLIKFVLTEGPGLQFIYHHKNALNISERKFLKVFRSVKTRTYMYKNGEKCPA